MYILFTVYTVNKIYH